MADPVEGQVPVVPAGNEWDGKVESLPAAVQKMVKELREENAATRVERNELRDKLATAKTPEEFQQIVAENDKRIAAAETARVRAEAARDAALPKEYDEFITASDEAGIRDQVAKLLGLAGLKKEPAPEPNTEPQVTPREPQAPGGNEPPVKSGKDEWETWKASR